MPLRPDLIACPVCYAALPTDQSGIRAGSHIDWHVRSGTLTHWSEDAVREELAYLLRFPYYGAGDDAPTAKLPPITDTVRRRPPVPPPAEVRELRGADLLRVLAEQLEREDLAELDREDQADDDAGDPA